MLIGLTGLARSGKDSAANILVQEFGFFQTFFAKALKEGVGRMLRLSEDQLYGDLKEVTDPFWGKSPRELLQFIGTELMRQQFDQDVWMKVVEREISQIPDLDWVVSDVRFLNEAEFIRQNGGYIIKLVRKGSGASNGIEKHPSEVEMDLIRPDFTIDNNGSFSDLRARLLQVVDALEKVDEAWGEA